MEMTDLCLKLRQRITEFKTSELYKNAKPLQYDTNAIEIAINLYELAIIHERKIELCEKEWFGAGYYLAMDFTGAWEDISKMYDQIAAETNAKYLKP